ncbi:MAG: hypothetical protein ACT4N2_15865 [Hyphomicrobium sp.]
MLTLSRRLADVQIIYITDERRDAERLARSLDHSERRICMASYPSSPTNMIAVWRAVSLARPFLPTAIIVDYFCKGGRCPDVMRDVRRLIEIPGVELIVANVPVDQETHDELKALGAHSVVGADPAAYEEDADQVQRPSRRSVIAAASGRNSHARRRL